MTAAPWPAIVIAAVLGLAIGSFLNVVIHRVPRHESVVTPASHCPTCDMPIKGRHNVPVFSWLMLRGRCAGCRVHISARYPLVEAGTAVLFAAVTERFGITAALPAFLYLAAIAVSLTMIDLDVRRLPDTIVLPSYVVGVLLLMPAAAVDGEWHTALRALGGMAAFLALFALLALVHPRGLGVSQVKLAGLLGLYVGWVSWSAVLVTAVASLLIAGLGGLLIGTTHTLRDGGPRRLVTVLVGPSLIGAAVLALFVTAPITHTYSSLVVA